MIDYDDKIAECLAEAAEAQDVEDALALLDLAAAWKAWRDADEGPAEEAGSDGFLARLPNVPGARYKVYLIWREEPAPCVAVADRPNATAVACYGRTAPEAYMKALGVIDGWEKERDKTTNTED